MRSNRTNRMYNILLPVWMIIFLPSWLWLLLIPANYLIDRLVLRWGVKELPDAGLFCRKNTWKICLAGFASDFIGCLLLFATMLLDRGNGAFHDIFEGVMMDPFSNAGSFAVVAAAVIVSAAVIYIIDKKILLKAGLTSETARSAALKLALITAPYLYFFPSRLLYR